MHSNLRAKPVLEVLASGRREADVIEVKPYLPEPATEEASPALITIPDRPFKRRAGPRRRVEVRHSEKSGRIQPIVKWINGTI
jgi:hypothetical protein